MHVYNERIFDAVHGFIHLSEDEKKLLEHPAFIRLHYLHQLGLAYLVYPGATHSRFEHSLGVMHLASKIYDQVFATPDPYLKQALRMGALCHDLGHLPFSHTLEQELLGEHGHEKKTLDMIELLKHTPFFKKKNSEYPPFFQLVLKIAVSPSVYSQYYPDDEYSDIEMLLSSIVSGDYFGADRIDYLIRDSRFTGVSVGLFDYPQLIEKLTLFKEGSVTKLAIEEQGLEAVEGLLLARHYMHARVYGHKGVMAYNQALKEFVKKITVPDFLTMDPSLYIKYTDAWLIQQFIEASFDHHHIAHKEALRLMSKSHKLDKKPPQVTKKLAKTLWVVKEANKIEALYPKDIETSLFLTKS